MKESAIKAQIIMNTLGQVNVPATAENVDKLEVIWQLLTQIRDEAEPAVPVTRIGEEDKDGKAET
jgi:hypothetical protein